MITARRGGLSRSGAPWLWVAALIAVSCPADASAAAALSPPSQAADCKVACGLVLGLSSFTVATGTVVTWGRVTGGISTRSQGTAIWTVSFGASLAAGAALYGEHRERAVFASGIGVVAGALVGFTLESLVGSNEPSTKLAATLIGAAVGAVAGGVYGALSYEEEVAATGLLASQRAPLLAVRFFF